MANANAVTSQRCLVTKVDDRMRPLRCIVINLRDWPSMGEGWVFVGIDPEQELSNQAKGAVKKR